MKQIVLSDHVNAQLQAVRYARSAGFQKQEEAYFERLAQHRRKLSERRDAIAQAWSTRRAGKLLWAILGWLWLKLRGEPGKPVYHGGGDDEAVWRSGEEGERSAAGFFGRTLSDDWTLLSGYYNPRGEIDLILVGPDGVFAVEIKHINGVVHCHGDAWWRDKYDRYGNRVEAGIPIQDRGGRSPSRQLNEPADRLAQRLEKLGGIEHVHRVVLLTHERARIGEMHALTVNAVASLHDLHPREILAVSKQTLSAEQVGKVVEWIRADHRFHQQRRKPNRKQAA